MKLMLMGCGLKLRASDLNLKEALSFRCASSIVSLLIEHV